MDIRDLTKLELKDLSFLKNRNSLINIGLIVFALIIAKNIYTGQIKKVELLKTKRETELKKNVLIDDISTVEKRINAYKKLLYERDTSSVINTITQLAENSEVKILSVRPEAEIKHNAYSEIPITLNILVKDYHQIGGFISKLESAGEVYIIKDFQIEPNTQAAKIGSNNVDRLFVNLKLITIIFKG